MADTTVHVFAGRFRDRDDACAYALDQWEPEPDPWAGDSAYSAWEERNPAWQLKTDLWDAYLDHDFIEVIADEENISRYDYLRSMLRNPNDIEGIRRSAGAQANILMLIFEDALGGFEAHMRSTQRVVYCGEFPCAL